MVIQILTKFGSSATQAKLGGVALQTEDFSFFRGGSTLSIFFHPRRRPQKKNTLKRGGYIFGKKIFLN